MFGHSQYQSLHEIRSTAIDEEAQPIDNQAQAQQPKSSMDMVVAMVFILNTFAFLGVTVSGCLALYKTSTSVTSWNGVRSEVLQNAATMIFQACFGTSLMLIVFSGINLRSLQNGYNGRLLLYFPVFVSVVGFLSCGIALVTGSSVVLGGLCIVFSLQNIILLYAWRSRLDLAQKVLESICSVIRQSTPQQSASQPKLLMLVFGYVVGVGVFGIIWLSAITGQVFNGSGTFAMIYMLFSAYWTLNVIQCCSLSVCSAVVCAEYLFNGSPSMPINPINQAVWQCVGTLEQFGKVCGAGLIMPLICAVKFITDFIPSNSLMDPFLNAVENLYRSFNMFGLLQLQVQKRSTFTQASSAAYDTMSNKDVLQLTTEFLTDKIQLMAAGSFSLIGSLVSYYMMKNGIYLQPLDNIAVKEWSQLQYLVLTVSLIQFFVAFNMARLGQSIVDGGITAILFVVCRDIPSLARTQPYLVEKLKHDFPQLK